MGGLCSKHPAQVSLAEDQHPIGDGQRLYARSTPHPPKRPPARFDEFADTWGGQYPAIVALWRGAWSEFVPFLDYDIEIRRVICSTNAIEILERPLPPSGEGPRALPDRAGRADSTDHRNSGSG